MKKIFLLSLLFLFIISLSPSQVQAEELFPIVQCGGEGQSDCTFCSFFDMINRITQIAILRVAPLIAGLMLTIGGGMFLFAGADPGTLTKANSLIKATVIGFILVFAAFMIVGTVLSAIGLAEWTENIYKSWWDPNQGFFEIPGC